jgi:N6-L-threonylcarbamoyladenine synthase
MNADSNPIHILAIESSCDDTSAAVLSGREVRSNVVATQEVHAAFGGVVPELASREHQKNIVPAVDKALKDAGITAGELDAIAVATGPGLLGSLLVGTSFAKSMSLALDIPLMAVDHMKAHILAHMIEDSGQADIQFPFMNLTVSGGHTQLVLVEGVGKMTMMGQSIDDAAGEAFDKTAKMLGLDYPGGPMIDKLAQNGDPNAFSFPTPKVGGHDFSFSGLKTSILYFVRDQLKRDSKFIEDRLEDICASVQKTIVEYLLFKLEKAALEAQVSTICICGGVSANSRLREHLLLLGAKHNWQARYPKFEYCTDNAAMIGIAGYYLFQEKDFAGNDVVPSARLKF